MKSRILELRAVGLTYAQIAAEVGLSTSRVGQIVKSAETRALIEQIRANSSADR
ncbi:helix-turn-helix domain-containing protein [Leucobacter rhizosphaerae]|uniref:Helix-turn-helix domain-containing protein n=1 Tax=Leucobacter rhizosphaerae TaxID=2932245 RepID=A0ABY4FVU5_9MICO|nr:helix-turn-helix domain-containing protein [Leucobacter rhizosphaerae]UOQ60402.1 helix-turn-helix domain-containing protein [Leucobacter rhizosphaerae]